MHTYYREDELKNRLTKRAKELWQKGLAKLDAVRSLVVDEMENEAVSVLGWQQLFLPLEDMFQRGGKRLRILLHAAQIDAEATEGSDYPLLLVPELIHSSSLIADDIEDNSPLRRGLKSVHLLYGIDRSLNTSSWGYFLATVFFEKLSISLQLRLHRLFQRTLRQLHSGQALDIYWHQYRDNWPSLSNYYSMCRLKTGSLLGFCCESACYLQDVEQSKTFKLACFWKDFGEMFQMLDDFLNLEQGVFGKEFGDDLLEGKKSWPLLYYLQRFSGKERLVRQDWLNTMITESQAAPEEKEFRAAVVSKLKSEGAFQQMHEHLENVLSKLLEQLMRYYRVNEAAGLFDLLFFSHARLKASLPVKSQNETDGCVRLSTI